VGISTLLGFVFTFSFLLNLVLKYSWTPVSAETEIAGLDIPEMGQLGYPSLSSNRKRRSFSYVA